MGVLGQQLAHPIWHLHKKTTTTSTTSDSSSKHGRI
jgi:hypothetical protein